MKLLPMPVKRYWWVHSCVGNDYEWHEKKLVAVPHNYVTAQIVYTDTEEPPWASGSDFRVDGIFNTEEQAREYASSPLLVLDWGSYPEVRVKDGAFDMTEGGKELRKSIFSIPRISMTTSYPRKSIIITNITS